MSGSREVIEISDSDSDIEPISLRQVTPPAFTEASRHRIALPVNRDGRRPRPRNEGRTARGEWARIAAARNPMLRDTIADEARRRALVRSHSPESLHPRHVVRRRTTRQDTFGIRDRNFGDTDESTDFEPDIDDRDALLYGRFDILLRYPGPLQRMIQHNFTSDMGLRRALAASLEHDQPWTNQVSVDDIKDKPASPQSTRAGYSRAIKPELDLVCAQCDLSLGEGIPDETDDEKKKNRHEGVTDMDVLLSKRVFYSKCGHVYCGRCVSQIMNHKRRKGKRDKESTVPRKCVVCSKDFRASGGKGKHNRSQAFIEIYY